MALLIYKVAGTSSHALPLYYLVSSLIILAAVYPSRRIGIFGWERGRVGFRERAVLSFETYDELRVSDGTLQEVL